MMEELITNAGFNTTLGKVLEALRNPFFSQTPPNTAPTPEALRFVVNLMNSTTLMAAFGKVVDALASSVEEANARITDFLKSSGYDCTALEVFAAFKAMRRKVLALRHGVSLGS